LNFVHIEFDFEANEYIFMGSRMDMDEESIIDHMTFMASKLPNTSREMELIHV